MEMLDSVGSDAGQISKRIHGKEKLSGLIIVDNFNAIPTQDPYLDEMLGYRCRIIFTTRSRYEDETTQEVTEMDGDTLLELVGKFYPDAQKHQREVRRIIELLHGNTFVVELAARLLKIGMLKPRKLRQKLEKEKTALDVSDKIGTKKDGKSRKATYYEHIHTLFSLYGLSKAEKEILRGMTMMPAKGIPAFMFAEWMGQKDMNVIHDLMQMLPSCWVSSSGGTPMPIVISRIRMQPPSAGCGGWLMRMSHTQLWSMHCVHI